MRSANRAAAAVLAATLAAAGVIILVEVVGAALRDGSGYLLVDWPGWVAAMTRNTWSDAGPRLAAVVLVAVGLLLLFLGLRPGPPDRFAVAGSSPYTATFVTRHGIADALRSAALAVDGVSSARVRVRRRRATARLRMHTRTAADAPARARSALASQLGAFRMTRPPTLRVRVRVVRPRRSRRGGRPDRVVPEPPPVLPPVTSPVTSPVVPPAGATQSGELPHDTGR